MVRQPQLDTVERRPNALIDVNVGLLRSETVLLMLRHDTGFQDGMLHLPAGHVEADEDAVSAAIREVEEEIGVKLCRTQLTFCGCIHRSGKPTRMSLLFAATNWWGQPTIREPNKCAGIGWYPLTPPPLGVVEFVALALPLLASGRGFFGAYGWEGQRQPLEVLQPVSA